MKKVFARRLLKVAQALRESPDPGKFTMVQFGHGCGTPACALGHYAARRDLQKTFKLNPDAYSKNESMLVNNTGFRVGYDDTEIENHFGIDSEESDELFNGSGCDDAQTPKQAAKYIETFVACKMNGTR